MTRNSLDREMILLIPFSLGAAVSVGLVAPTVLGSFDLSQAVFTVGGVDFSYARVVAIAALVGVVANRDATVWETGGLDMYVAYTTVGLVIAPPFLPLLQNTLAQQPAAIITFMVQSVGFTLISYSN